jgi:phosphoglycolate phosphatase
MLKPKLPSKPCAFFDLDGTILDTIIDITNSFNRSLQTLGFPGHTPPEYKAWVGNSTLEICLDALPKGAKTEENGHKLLSLFTKDYEEHRLDDTKPYPGIPELLQKLTDLGWVLGVLSNKEDFNAIAMTEYYFPEVFTIVLGTSDTRPHKPDPTGAFEGIKLLDRKPRDVFYFGDTEIDMETAVNAGLVGVGVSWGFRSTDTLIKSGAKIILDKPEDFFSFLKDTYE